MKSFYASVECVDRGLHPLKTSPLCDDRADNSSGLILASSPMFKKYLGKRMLVGLMIYPLMSKPENFLTITQKSRDFQRIQDFVRILRNGSKTTFIVPPRMDKYIEVNMEIQRVFKTTVAPMKYTLIRLMRALLT